MLKLFLQISLLTISLILVSCKDNPIDPKQDQTSVIFKLEKGNNVNHQSIFGSFFNKMQSGFENKGLLKTTAFDEVRIICLDMTKWRDINEFWDYWQTSQGYELFEHELWDSTKDVWDNYVLLFKQYPGNAFEFIADYGFTIKDSVAKGTIFLNPGLNYFIYGFRNNGITGFVSETSAVIVKDSTNNITLHYSNQAPEYPFNPHPPAYAYGVIRNVVLRWECSDPDFDPLKYNVYFGTSSVPSSVAQGITAKEYTPGNLLANTTYYWRVDAMDDHGNMQIGDLWQFTTGQ